MRLVKLAVSIATMVSFFDLRRKTKIKQNVIKSTDLIMLSLFNAPVECNLLDKSTCFNLIAMVMVAKRDLFQGCSGKESIPFLPMTDLYLDDKMCILSTLGNETPYL